MVFQAKMKMKLFKTIAAHYGLISTKSSNQIKAHITLAQKNLYSAFHGFKNHVEGSKMVCSSINYNCIPELLMDHY